MRKLLMSFGLLLTPLACSGEDDSPMSREDFCQSWARAACSEEVVAVCGATDADVCRVRQQAFCLELVPTSFADDKADACLRRVEQAYTDADLTAEELPIVLRLGPPCDQVIRGSREEGESCMATRDCNAPAGYQCVTKGGATSGTCEVPEIVQGGFECTAAQEVCAANFYCNGSNCVTHKQVGAPCSSQDECGTAAYCGTEGTCVARAAVNTPCSQDRECLSGLCHEFSAADRVCIDRLRLSRSEPTCDNFR